MATIPFEFSPSRLIVPRFSPFVAVPSIYIPDESPGTPAVPVTLIIPFASLVTLELFCPNIPVLDFAAALRIILLLLDTVDLFANIPAVFSLFSVIVSLFITFNASTESEFTA